MQRHDIKSYAVTRFGQVHCRDVGKGRPIVLLHQAGRSARMFSDLIGPLAEEMRVIAIDLPGFGASDQLPPGSTIAQLAEAVIEVAGQLKIDRFDLYGLHTGNKVAAAIAVAHPEHVGKVVLSGQSHSLIPDQKERNAAITHEAAADMTQAPESDFSARASDWLARARKVSNVLLDPAIGAAKFSPEAGRRALDAAIDRLSATGTAALYEANLSYDLGADMARIQAPTLVLEIVTQDEDHRLGRQAKAVVERIPDCAQAFLAEPDGPSTLEGRGAEVAAIVLDFIRDKPEAARRTA